MQKQHVATQLKRAIDNRYPWLTVKQESEFDLCKHWRPFCVQHVLGRTNAILRQKQKCHVKPNTLSIQLYCMFEYFIHFWDEIF